MLNKKKNPLVTLLIISFSYYAIYNLQIMKSLYYSAIQYGFDISNTQVGVIFSVCGICAMFAYLCGSLSRSFLSVRTLTTCSLMILGGFSLILSMLPPYPILLVIFGGAGFLVNAAFYPAYLAIMTDVGGPYHQGEAYAKFYIFSSIFGSIFAMVGFGITAMVPDPTLQLRGLLLFFALLNFLGAAGTFLFLPPMAKQPAPRRFFDLRAVKMIGRNKRFWLSVIIILANYVNFSNLTYTLPYLTNKFDLPGGLVNILSILRVYVLVIVAAPIAGWITDRIQSAARLMKWAFFLYLFALLIMIFLCPGNPMGTVLCVIAICFFVSLGKSMSLVVVQEIGLPPFLAGLIFSLTSFLAYSPDSYYYYISGWMLDRWPDEGYFYVFLISALVAAAGFLAAQKFCRTRTH